MSFTVLTIGDQIAAEGVALIHAAGGTIVPSGAWPDRETVLRLMAEHQPDAVIVRTIGFLDEEMMLASARLRLAAKHGVGVNEIDVAAAERLGIPVVITTGANSQSVAEHAFGMILALGKDFARQDTHIRAGRFDKRLYAGRELKGQVLGIIGCGSIGSKVARMGQAFGMTVMAYDPLKPPRSLGDGVDHVTDVDALVAAADFVTLHCPATQDTLNLMDARRIALMKPSAVLVNTARGDVVDEAALTEALVAGRIAGAGLDVFVVEPPPRTALLELPNVILSQHIAGVTQDAMRAVSIMAAGNVTALFAGTALAEDRFVNAPRSLRPLATA